MMSVAQEKRKVTLEDWLLSAGSLLLVIMFFGLAWNWKSLPPQLPWQYSLPWGESQLIGKEIFAGLLVGMMGLFGLTKLLSTWVGEKDETVRTIIVAGGVVSVMLYFAGFWRVLSIFVGK